MRQPAITQYIDAYWDKLVRQQPEDQKNLNWLAPSIYGANPRPYLSRDVLLG